MAQSDVTIFEQYPVATWKVGAAPAVAFPVQKIVESGGKRLVKHARPYRDAEKLDDTGRKGRVWKVTALFNNTLEEPGVNQNGVPLYPDALRMLVNTVDERGTGDLQLPTVGQVRARIEVYDRTESFETRDTGELELTFTEDNEEALAAATFRPPSVKTTSQKLAEAAQFSSKSAGAWDADTSTLFEVAGQVITALEAPGRQVSDVRAQAEALRRTVRRVVASQTELASNVDGDYNDPRGSSVHRELALLEDRMALAESEKNASLPPTKVFVVDVEECSLFSIAARFQQNAEQLIDLNMGRVEDPFDVRRDDVILIFA